MKFSQKTCSTLCFGLLICLAEGARGEPIELRISRADCARLAAHIPSDDVTYRSGVDVRGRPVAPADLDDAPALALPESYRVRIEVDSDDRFGIPTRAGSYDADIVIGEALVEADGRVLFNGQPLQSEAAFEVGRRCRELIRQTP